MRRRTQLRVGQLASILHKPGVSHENTKARTARAETALSSCRLRGPSRLAIYRPQVRSTLLSSDIIAID